MPWCLRTSDFSPTFPSQRWDNALGSPSSDNYQNLYIYIPFMVVIADRAVVWGLHVLVTALLSATLHLPPFPELYKISICVTAQLLMAMGQADLWLDGICVQLWSLAGGYYGLSATQDLETHRFPALALNDLDSLGFFLYCWVSFKS